MMPEPVIPVGEPASIVRGTTAKWTRGFAEYLPEDGWALAYHLVTLEGYKTFAGVDNSDSTFLIDILNTDTASYAPGIWKWQAIVTKSPDVFIADRGTLEVEVGFADIGAAHDGRSFYEQLHERVQEMLMQSGTAPDLSVSFDGYSASFETHADLMRFERRVAGMVRQEKRREQMRRGRNSRTTIASRF